jgi:UDP-3-O-[3-hydroxymyristoyl] glucosamine N-acyltransferase
MPVRIHPTAEVSESAIIGDNTNIWHHAQVREGAIIGEKCIIGQGVYIDADVKIGITTEKRRGKRRRCHHGLIPVITAA